jgi:hypothetical protein
VRFLTKMKNLEDGISSSGKKELAEDSSKTL